MTVRLKLASWLGIVAGVLWAGTALAQDKSDRWTTATLPLDQMPPAMSSAVKKVAEHTTVYARGATEEFPCRPALYYWLLDHPDSAIEGWKRLGARCVSIDDKGEGRFSWSDGNGSEIHWVTAYKSETLRIWYAEGSVKPGKAVPKVGLEAVLILRHLERKDGDGRPVMYHQADLMLHTDGKVAAAVAKTMNASAPHLGEEYLSNVERFFSVLACYLDQHPEQLKALLSGRDSTPKAP